LSFCVIEPVKKYYNSKLVSQSGLRSNSQNIISVTIFVIRWRRWEEVICITVTSYITRFSVLALRRDLFACTDLVFSRVIYSRRRLYALRTTSGAVQHRQFRRCYMRIGMRVCAHRAIWEISRRVRRRPRAKTWRKYTCMRLSIAPQSLLSANAYLFTARRDIFRIDVRIYVTWE